MVDEKYEGLRKYFKEAEAREQQYICTIIRQNIEINNLKRKLEEVELWQRNKLDK